jgi:predicted RNA-binding Zn ribbon-like protein
MVMPANPARTAGSDPGIGQAPADLAVLQAFVNTRDVEEGTDELASPADLDAWLGQAGLTSGSGGVAGSGGPGGASGPGELATAIELREALRGVLRSHVTHGPGAERAAGAEPAARLAAVASAMTAGIQADAAGRVSAVPAGVGSRAGLTRLLLIAAEAATLGTWTRLKVCSAGDCQWAFYDRSPTRSGCWCSMQICGSRAKSRAYRRRGARPVAADATARAR